MNSKVIAITINFHSEESINKLKKQLADAVGQVIVIDNCENNRGFAKAVNLGIKEALEKGATKILLINPDIEISKSNLEKLFASSFDITSPILEFERSGVPIRDFGGKVNLVLGRPTHFENIRVYNIDFVSGACMLIKKEVFEKIGFLDETFFMYFEDVDFCLRARQTGFEIGVTQTSTANHKIEEHKLIRNDKKKTYILESNKAFVKKWVPAIYQPLAQLYLLFLRAR